VLQSLPNPDFVYDDWRVAEGGAEPKQWSSPWRRAR
jgi:hypothetical protein